MELSDQEVELITRIRKIEFGTIEVHKVDGQITRTITTINELVKKKEVKNERTN